MVTKESNFDRVPLPRHCRVIAIDVNITTIKTDGVDTAKLFTGTFTHNDQKSRPRCNNYSVTVKLSNRGKTLHSTTSGWILAL
jgi:hypothetical protein